MEEKGRSDVRRASPLAGRKVPQVGYFTHYTGRSPSHRRISARPLRGHQHPATKESRHPLKPGVALPVPAVTTWGVVT